MKCPVCSAELTRVLYEMTPEARAEFEQNVKKLKAQNWTIGSVVLEAFVESFWRRI
ncbi:MAG: hypothetical protein JW809_02250 [Pirellulales bacterium]|nr:hypothetical protein [Pirellulales bacterium]